MFEIKRALLDLPHDILHFYSYRRRCNDAKSDLNKGLNNSVPISESQKNYILNFWQPYLNSWRKKHAFDIKWFDIYNRTNVFGFDLAQYIPDGYYYSIIDRCLTDELGCNVLDDKNLYDLYFRDVNQPRTIIRKIKGVLMDSDYNILSEQKAVEMCVQHEAVILKPSINAMQGHGIVFWYKYKNSIQELKSVFASGSDFVVQELIRQHSFLASFTNSCVNTMRIVTLLWNDEVKVTTAVLIMGGKDASTNHLHGGGIVCGILPDGYLRHTAFDGELNEYKVHPNGIRFQDVQIPNYDKCIALVKHLAPRMSGVSKFLNWDLTIDERGNPLLIEVNLTYGGSVQIAGGPAFGDMTKEVLDYVNKVGIWK